MDETLVEVSGQRRIVLNGEVSSFRLNSARSAPLPAAGLVHLLNSYTESKIPRCLLRGASIIDCFFRGRACTTSSGFRQASHDNFAVEPDF